MRLFAVGEISPHPTEWTSPDRVIVLAQSKEQAIEMACDWTFAVEVNMDSAAILL